ncbi:MAG: hypothetical protein AUH76_19920 [Candidatus Rokubacteria bacterium 13_1_40CM_4_67_11]|nr:MAG: hypothetical protein AUH76_19920 [Candidatus Rokubacteria bacterium 13_1_40CM_4_67_11]
MRRLAERLGVVDEDEAQIRHGVDVLGIQPEASPEVPSGFTRMASLHQRQTEIDGITRIAPVESDRSVERSPRVFVPPETTIDTAEIVVSLGKRRMESNDGTVFRDRLTIPPSRIVDDAEVVMGLVVIGEGDFFSVLGDGSSQAAQLVSQGAEVEMAVVAIRPDSSFATHGALSQSGTARTSSVLR